MLDNELPTPVEFRSRRVGLGCFGSVLILLGGVAVLFALVTGLSLLAFPGPDAQPAGAMNGRGRASILLAFVYLPIASGLIWLGIGSILARRWARALILVLSYFWMAIGVGGMFMMLSIVPGLQAQLDSIPDSSPEVTRIVTFIMLGILLTMYVVVPAAFILFYRSKHVKATCEQVNMSESWTDRCSLPVLGMMVVLCSHSLGWVVAIAYARTFPFFGLLLRGMPAVALGLLLSSGYIWLAWGAYRQRRSAWSFAVVLSVLSSVSAVLTYSQVNMRDEYSRLGFSADELAAVDSMGMTSGPMQLGMVIVPIAIWLIYLLMIRRHFHEGGREAAG